MRKLLLCLLVGLVLGCAKDSRKDYSEPNLLQLLKSKDPDMRYSAAKALGKYGPDAKDAVPALIDALKDDNAMVRSGVAYALGNIGPDAKDALPALKVALKDRDKDVRDAAAYAIDSIEGKGGGKKKKHG